MFNVSEDSVAQGPHSLARLILTAHLTQRQNLNHKAALDHALTRAIITMKDTE